MPFAWLQADAADNDPLVFLQYLTAALDGVLHVDPLVEQWLQLAPPPVETRILPALAAAVAERAPFVLVVDDAHLVTRRGLLADPAAARSTQLPPGAHLCLSGRRPAPLPALSPACRGAPARVRAGGARAELPTRPVELLALHGVSADAETAARLTGVTEGWAAGLHLAALAGEHDPRTLLAGIHGDRRDIARYLASEVLEQQPPDIAEFLLQTSILERLSPSLCRSGHRGPRRGRAAATGGAR